MNDEGCPCPGSPADSQPRHRQPSRAQDVAFIRRERERLMRVDCECETQGWCWSCAELDRLRDREHDLAPGGRP